MEENYEELEGKRVLVYDEDIYSEPFYCKVIGCEKDIGVSLVNDDYNVDIGKGKEALCLHGPSSPNHEGYSETYSNYAKNYGKAFDQIVKEIKAGVIRSDVYTLLDITEDEIPDTEQSMLEQILGLPPRDRNLNCSFK